LSALEEKIEERIIEFQKNYKFELPQRVILAQEVVSAIEHTLLRPTATEEETDSATRRSSMVSTAYASILSTLEEPWKS